jgi:hypothetical protein
VWDCECYVRLCQSDAAVDHEMLPTKAVSFYYDYFMSDWCLTSLQQYICHIKIGVSGRANHITWGNQNSWGNQITNLIKITSLTSLH